LEVQLPPDLAIGVNDRIAKFSAAQSMLYTKTTEKRSKSYDLKEIILALELQDNRLMIRKKLESPSLYDVLEAVLGIAKQELYRARILRISLA
nr:hypothetical protein [Candidatus Cloacimonadota bacterium]